MAYGFFDLGSALEKHSFYAVGCFIAEGDDREFVPSGENDARIEILVGVLEMVAGLPGKLVDQLSGMVDQELSLLELLGSGGDVGIEEGVHLWLDSGFYEVERFDPPPC